MILGTLLLQMGLFVGPEGRGLSSQWDGAGGSSILQPTLGAKLGTTEGTELERAWGMPPGA